MKNNWKQDYARYKSFFLNIWSLYNAKPNVRAYLELILSIVTIIGFSLFAIKPTVITILELNKEIKSKENTVFKMQTKIRNLQTASNVLQDNVSSLTLINQAVPKSAQTDFFIKQIENTALSNSVSITSFSTSDTQIVGGETIKSKKNVGNQISANELKFTLTLKASDYPSIFAFIEDVEKFRRPVKIDGLTLNSTSSDTGRSVNLTINGRAPFILEIEKN
jgi:Tfp pilus assembly protein PilO